MLIICNNVRFFLKTNRVTGGGQHEPFLLDFSTVFIRKRSKKLLIKEKNEP